MSRRVQAVILCEDKQQEVFVRRLLVTMEWPKRNLRLEPAPAGQGSAEQFVRKQFPKESRAYRRKRGHVALALIVVMDGDHRGVQGRLAELDETCRQDNVEVRRPDDHVLVAIPTWEIETWLAYLGGEAVDEASRGYPRLQRESECKPHVEALAAMCRERRLRRPAPPSLESACAEYEERLRPRLGRDHDRRALR